MKIGLWSDCHNFPSLPMMKLSAWHKFVGDEAELFDYWHGYDTLRDLGYYHYVMIYQKETSQREIRKLQRYVNFRQIFRSIQRFEDYSG